MTSGMSRPDRPSAVEGDPAGAAQVAESATARESDARAFPPFQSRGQTVKRGYVDPLLILGAAQLLAAVVVSEAAQKDGVGERAASTYGDPDVGVRSGRRSQSDGRACRCRGHKRRLDSIWAGVEHFRQRGRSSRDVGLAPL